ncbi:MAG: PAS domain-containing protein [Ignavibacteriae bacterium]|nr:MAG: PAS domain-containing protein [Ignavibacteriota bacterium]
MKHNKNKSNKSRHSKAKKIIEAKPEISSIKLMKDLQKLAQLLQIHQVELEHQNQELRMAQEELEVSRNKYVNLFDFSPIPYFTLDVDDVIKEVNMCASTMLGIDRNKLMNKHFSAYIPLAERDMFYSFLKTVFSSSAKQTCELTVMNKDKRIFHVRMDGLEVVDSLETDRKCQVALIELK